MKKEKFYSYINYSYLALVVLWEPLQRAFIQIDGQGRILAASGVAILIFNFYKFDRFRNNFLIVPSIFLLALVAYSAINLMYKGYHVETPFVYFFLLYLFKQFVVFMVAMFEAQKNPILLSKVLLSVLSVYAVLSITAFGGELVGHEGRELGELGNMSPLTVMYMAFFASLLYVENRIGTSKFLAVVIVCLYIIVVAATRKALGGMTIILLFLLISQIDFRSKNISFVVFGFVFMYFAGGFILENTFIGERLFSDVWRGGDDDSNRAWWSGLLGDRIVFYTSGWEIFLNNIFTGIGLRNYLYTTSSAYVLHTEYMVQLAENGLIGFSLFSVFNLWFLKRLLGVALKNRAGRRGAMVMLGGVGSILFVSLTAWIYSFPQYFIVYGTVAGLILRGKYLGVMNER